MHSDRPPFKCSTCHLGFKYRNILRKHIRQGCGPDSSGGTPNISSGIGVVDGLTDSIMDTEKDDTSGKGCDKVKRELR